MSEVKTFAVEKRDGLGKGANRQLRMQGMVPGIFYSTTGENIAVKMPQVPLQKLHSEVSNNTVFNLDIEGEVRPCLLWKLENHPFRNRVQHVDFYGVDLEKPLRVKIPVVITGSCPALKLGGKLEVYRELVTLEAKPMDMPKQITVDISSLTFNDTVMVSSLELPEGVSAWYSNDFAVLGIATGRGASAAAAEEK